MTHVAHLVRRFATSLSSRPPSAADLAWVSSILGEPGWSLWTQMSVPDRRHSVLVARRFAEAEPSAPQTAVAGVLLHDVGKVAAGLGTFGRVVATVVGRHGRRFRTYGEHERIGAEMARAAGLAESTAELIEGRGPWAPALRAADEL